MLTVIINSCVSNEENKLVSEKALSNSYNLAKPVPLDKKKDS